MLHTQTLLAYCGLAAALGLFLTSQSRGLAIVSVVAAALEVLIPQLPRFGIHLSGITLDLILGIALAVPALIIWFKASGKSALTSSSLAAFIGLFQVAAYVLPRM